MYNKVTPEIIEKFKAISGSLVYVGDDINPDYHSDEMRIYGSNAPEVTIDVSTTEEISEIMKICYENNIPVTVRGAGTGLVGGANGAMIGSMIDTQYTGSLNMGYGAVLSCTLLIVLSIIMALTKLATAKAQKAVGGDLGGV